MILGVQCLTKSNTFHVNNHNNVDKSTLNCQWCKCLHLSEPVRVKICSEANTSEILKSRILACLELLFLPAPSSAPRFSCSEDNRAHARGMRYLLCLYKSRTAHSWETWLSSWISNLLLWLWGNLPENSWVCSSNTLQSFFFLVI